MVFFFFFVFCSDLANQNNFLSLLGMIQDALIIPYDHTKISTTKSKNANFSVKFLNDK
jgi:hypothetical protein